MAYHIILLTSCFCDPGPLPVFYCCSLFTSWLSAPSAGILQSIKLTVAPSCARRVEEFSTTDLRFLVFVMAQHGHIDEILLKVRTVIYSEFIGIGSFWYPGLGLTATSLQHCDPALPSHTTPACFSGCR